MTKDIRNTATYQEAHELFAKMRQPGTGQVSDAADVHVSPNGQEAVFSGTLTDALEGTPDTRICRVNLESGELSVLTFGPNSDRLPKYSPDGRRIAFLSDRHKRGDFQLYLLDVASGAAQVTPQVGGWVEYIHWSPDGRRILLGVAGHGADISGGQGAVTSQRTAEKAPSWIPSVDSGEDSSRWRRVWLYELASGGARQLTGGEINAWEADWCGDEAIAAVVSDGPAEGLWYSACLSIVDVETGKGRRLYKPTDQIGWPAAHASGERVAIVEAACSDRWIVAGNLTLIDTSSGEARSLDTRGVNVTYAEWRSDHLLLVAGVRGFETVVGVCDVDSGEFRESWASRDLSTSGFSVTVSGLKDPGDCVLVGEGFLRAPEIGVIRKGQYSCVRSFDLGYTSQAKATISTVEHLTWTAPDGLEIQGWLLRPRGEGPYPLIMNIHGGPVSHWRPVWLGRKAVAMLMLLGRGYAVFLPNPRGSSGRGQDFARRVRGDMGGADTHDYLSGIDYLVDQDLADPNRLGVTGGSYGGYMTYWLITQDRRFSAAVALAPVSNKVSQHLICNIPQFVSLFLADSYFNPGGKYFQRSPIMHAHKVTTPTLSICGALDRCTPPEEAVQFHNALLENGVTSVLVTYPEEGHGIRKLPAAIDYASRLVSWFEDRMKLASAS